MSGVDISAVITFHREGTLAQATMHSISRCLDAAMADGAHCEVVALLDTPCPLTDLLVRGFAWPCQARCIPLEAGDAAAARNLGVAESFGRHVAMFDGDDYYSSDWLRLARSEAQRDPGRILHTEYVGLFGAENAFYRHLDMSEAAFDPAMLLTWNPWTAWTFADRELHLSYPFSLSKEHGTGFGYEDWHWNCETLAGGVRHGLVPGTAGFYRKKPHGRFARETGEASLVAPTAFFDRPYARA